MQSDDLAEIGWTVAYYYYLSYQDVWILCMYICLALCYICSLWPLEEWSTVQKANIDSLFCHMEQLF